MTKSEVQQIIEALHRIELVQVDIRNDLERNTDDIATHIKRTNLLEKKLSKIYTAMLIGIGVALSHFGPNVFKLLGILI